MYSVVFLSIKSNNNNASYVIVSINANITITWYLNHLLTLMGILSYGYR